MAVDPTKKSDKWMRVYEFFRHRTRHYNTWFKHSDGRVVLMDLARFCFANRNTIGNTVEQTYVAIGRREVWLYIQERLTLTPEQLTDLYVSTTKEM